MSLLFLAGASCAEAPARQYPCQENEQFDAFDFWAGEWGVHGVAGKLAGTIHTVGDNATQRFRGLWTALPDGRVRQFFELSTGDGATWATWFDGYYARKSVDESSDWELS